MGNKWNVKKGDFVRVVVEAEVRYADDTAFETANNGFYNQNEDIVSVEVIKPPVPPLPTTPGSVVNDADSLYVLVGSTWKCASGKYDDIDFTAAMDNDNKHGHVTVVFDAGRE